MIGDFFLNTKLKPASDLPSSFGIAAGGSVVNFVSAADGNENLKLFDVVVAVAGVSIASSGLRNENVVVRFVAVDVDVVVAVAGDEPNEKPDGGVEPNENPVDGAPNAAATAGEAVVVEETKENF